MKLSGKITRHKLKVSSDTGILFLGLVTPEPDYKISLLLNSLINSNFKSNDPYVTGEGDNTACRFSRFSSESEINDLKLDLICNRSGSCVIDKKLLGIDYIFIIRGLEGPETQDEIIKILRENRTITAVFNLEKNISIAENILLQIH